MTILGFSSSPVTGGNVDRMVQSILEQSAKPSEFINLTKLSYSPCRACAHLCADDNFTILPCFKCGFGKVCEVGGSQTVYGKEGRKNLKITKDLFKQWENFPAIVRDLDNLSQILKEHGT